MNAICTVEANYVSSMDRICKLFYHECTRSFGDKILMKHDLKWFQNTLKNVCAKNFYDLPEKNLIKNLVASSSEESSDDDPLWF